MIFYPKVAMLVAAPVLLLIADIGPTPEFQILSSLGIGGVLAFITMRYYREDRKTSDERYAADRKASEDRYSALASEYRKQVIENTVAITQNTDAVTRLRDLLVVGQEGRVNGKP